jgi:MoaA/NifB/PqqE/SkfB family radical SAM enzyme
MSMRAGTAPPATTMALMVTRRCNMRCGHCSVESGPDVRGEPSEQELLDQVRQAAAAEVRSINLTGGEPMLRPRTVLRLVRAARRLGVGTTLTTNGSWGRTAARARRFVGRDSARWPSASTATTTSSRARRRRS